MVKDATTNLLSLRELLKCGDKFEGNKQSLKIFDVNGICILIAKDRGNGFWTCTRSEVQQLAASAMVTNSTVSQPSYSAEERTRAKQAFGLCRLLGHPSDQALTRLLDCGNMLETEITSQDLRTARTLYGLHHVQPALKAR